MGKGLHKVFKTVVKYISQYLPTLGESGSEVYHFIPEPKNCAKVTRLSCDVKQPWLKATQKEIKNLINNHNFLVQDSDKGEPMNPRKDVYRSKIQFDGSLYKIKLRIFVREDLQNKELVGDTWSTTVSIRILKYFLADAVKHKTRVHQLYFNGVFLQAKV